ncbi:MAG: tRNA (adenosine(37)-N6)-dimethylallyltransferase [Pirellula sp.]
MQNPSKLPSDWIIPPLDHVLYLTGPTASGKTQVALELADALAKNTPGVEVISVDSMAIYRGMDIGTAKPSRQIREQVTHHLIDIVDPTEDYSVSEFLKDAHAKVAEIQSRGKRPLLVGGYRISRLRSSLKSYASHTSLVVGQPLGIDKSLENA